VEGGRGRGIYSGGTKAPVGAEQPVPNIRHWHWLTLPTGAFALGTWRHRVIARPGAIVSALDTGWCHHPVPIPPWAFGTSWWHHPVPIREFWYRVVL